MGIQSTFPEQLDDVWIYLRKSREDREAEERARREGRTDIETLSRHRSTLLELAKRFHHRIARERILEEVVSGEYISERPQIQKLITAVERGEATAVWVMDLDRLGRGDMADQGIILRAFKDSATLILTPDKVYNLNDEMDEEWTEFKTFFARRELKMITKRMQRGRIASVKEGKFIGARPPFGYDIGQDLILVQNEHADTVRQIFNLYVNQGLGCARIAHYLNDRGIKSPMGKTWRPESVIALIRNPVYGGWNCWRKMSSDKRHKKYHQRPESEWIKVKGRHEALVDERTFERSVKIRKARSHAPVRSDKKIASPLTSLVVCGKCGERLVRRPYADVSRAQMRCKNPACNQKSANEDLIEAKFLKALSEWLRDYKITTADMPAADASVPNLKTRSLRLHKNIEADIARVNGQRDRLHDLLEQGVYDTDTYIERNQKLLLELSTLYARKELVENEIAQLNEERRSRVALSPPFTDVLASYKATKDVAARNRLLRTVIQKAVYNKEKWQREDQFELTLYPLI